MFQTVRPVCDKQNWFKRPLGPIDQDGNFLAYLDMHCIMPEADASILLLLFFCWHNDRFAYLAPMGRLLDDP